MPFSVTLYQTLIKPGGRWGSLQTIRMEYQNNTGEIA